MEEKDVQENPCGKRKEPEPDSDDTEKEEQGQKPKKVITIYDWFRPWTTPSHAAEQSDVFYDYTFEQPSSSTKYNWFQR